MKKIVNNHQSFVNQNDLAQFSQKDAKWDHYRSKTELISQIYAKSPKFIKYHEKTSQCADILKFNQQVDQETGEIGLKLNQAYFCKVRHCPVCAWRRSMRNTAKFFNALPDLQKQHPTMKYLFLTLTVKNCNPEHLRETLKTMNHAWQKLTQRKNWPALGFIRSTEITRSQDGKAHPHFHAVLAVNSNYFTKNYVSQKQWAELWQAALKVDYEPMVNIKRVTAKKDGQTLHSALLETLKYSVKADDLLKDEKWLYTITEQLHRTRFLATGGIFKDLMKDTVSNDEMVVTETDKLENSAENSLFFGWQRSILKYRKLQK